MLTKAEARALILSELTKHNDASTTNDLVVTDDHTIERPWGWVFFYSSQRHLDTRDIRHALAGNAPFIVNRHTGEIRHTGTAHPIEHYIAEYEQAMPPRH